MADPLSSLEGRVRAWASSRPAALRAGVVSWALAVGALFLLGLGGAPLFDVDEGAFAEATREMLAGGDFGFTTLNGAPRFDKPILVYWLQAASVSLLGLHEAALRLPSALCAWAWSLAVARFAWTRFGAGVALLAGTVLATSVGVLAIGRAATADALLNLLLALALLDGWRHLETGRNAPLRRTYVWIGLGLLAKGPIALVVPGATALLYCAASREWRRFRAAAGAAAAALVLVTAVIPWVGDVLQGPVKRAAEVARSRPEPAVQWGVHVPSFSVYREQVTPRSAPAGGQLAVVRAYRLQPLDPAAVLYLERGYALVRWGPEAGSPRSRRHGRVPRESRIAEPAAGSGHE